MPKVWTYPEKRWEELGAVRWEVEWWTLRPGAQDLEEHDPDRDIRCHYRTFKTRAAAVKYAKGVVSRGESFYGCATVQEQRVDWYVEEDRIAEWVDVGREEQIDSEDAAA